MKILQVHNYYQQAGGEDRVFESEAALLRDAGHEVVQYTQHNDAIRSMGRLELAARTLWSQPACRELQRLLETHDFDVAHFHNTFPLISPAAYWTCRKADVPVVQTLHNYRLGCPAATFYRDGHICEDCLGKKVAWPAVRHGCYRGSRLETAGVASMLAFHRMIGTWRRAVDLYIALTEFARDKMIEIGLPAEKIVVKPNGVYPDSTRCFNAEERRGFALFVGRLSEEKGILTLLEAWEGLPHIPLKIAGDGPLRAQVESTVRQLSWVSYLGYLPSSEVDALMSQSRLVLLPSNWFEGFPLVFAAACARSLPVVSADSVAIAQDSIPQEFRFSAGDRESLAATVKRVWADSSRLDDLGTLNRHYYESVLSKIPATVSLLSVLNRAR